jgi:hypothetical protein
MSESFFDAATRLGEGNMNGHAPSGEPTPSSITWAHGRALYERPRRTIAHLVDGVIPVLGSAVVSGEDKAGKSTLTLLLALCYMHGVPFLNRAIVRPGRVLLVSEEDDADELRDRLRALHVALAQQVPIAVLPPDDDATLALLEDRLIWEARDGVRLDDDTIVDGLVAQIAALRGREPDGPPVLVLIDSLQAVRGLTDPGTPAGIGLIKLALRRLTAAGAVVVLVAHSRKVPSGGRRTARASQEIAGSHELAAEASCTLGLMPISPRPDSPMRLDLVSKRGRSGVLGYLRIVHTPADSWPPESIDISLEKNPPSPARTAPTDTAVLDALPVAADGVVGVSVEAIAKTAVLPGKPVGLSDKTVRRALKRLLGAKRCLVTEKLSNGTELFARIPNDSP